MKISVKLEVSQNTSHHTFDLEDLNVTEQQWKEMGESEKNEIIQNALFDLEQPFWMVDSFYEKE